ncbi:MAG: Rne/Rng family ribonuclease [Clostridia bacterium]|nr:Rne/Rng family ribonuclease [Clostridia bacterium]
MRTGLILVDVEPYMSSVSLVEEGKLKEHYVEYKDMSLITGNIYKAQVVNVLNGLQSAFINFGGSRNGFLSVGETIAHKTVLTGAGVMPKSLDVKEGDYVMVQATKEEIGSKGARLSTTVNLPGRYLIFLPTINFIGVSNKITTAETREKFTKLLSSLSPEGCGFIARTACLEGSEEEIVDEANRLIKQWNKVLDAYNKAEGIAQVYSDGDMIFRYVRDMLSANIDAIVCNDLATIDALKSQFEDQNISFCDNIRYYNGQYDIFDAFNILDEVDKLLDRRVKLPSGLTLVFDYTEALTVIDVNTSAFMRGQTHEETVFEANLEAAREIARQIRLRNIGGIIVVDFIDMQDEAHKAELVEVMKRELLFDRTKTRVIGMSALGLLEITRKKVGRELSTILLDKCSFCDGNARSHSVDYVARKIKARLKRMFADSRITSALVTLNASIIDQICKNNYFKSDCETIWKDKKIYFIADKEILNRNFTVKALEKEKPDYYDYEL